MKVQVQAPNGQYAIDIGINKLSRSIAAGYKHYAVITDATVFGLYGHHFEQERTIILPPGEPSKSFANLEMILNRLLELGLNRNDAVIALGGGVVGDIAGFAAAIFKRGIQLVQVPTTLLAQVDSSVGGKVAVNLAGGKNMAGTFYQPHAVVADTGTLETLDKREFAAGMAEVIKYAYIADKSLYVWLREGNMPLERIIHTCCQIKADIVAQDPFDTGIRMILNYGHTVGHAIETAAGYGTFLHGEAVAAGMVYAALLGEKLGISPTGLREDTAALVSKYNLPYTVGNELLRKALGYIAADKKAQDGKISLILLDSVGKAGIHEVETDKIIDILGEYAL